MSKSTKILLITACLLLFLPLVVLAQGETGQPAASQTQSEASIEASKPELHVKIGQTELNFETVSCKPGEKCEIGWISQYVVAIYKYGIGLAAVLAVVMIMVGGFVWLMSGGSSTQVSTAKDFIVSAMSGLLLALFSFMLLYIVNPRLVNLDKVGVFAPNPPERAEPGASGSSELEGESESYAIPSCSVSSNFTGVCRTEGQSSADAIAEAAEAAIGEPLGVCPATDYGNRGCAMAVNNIVQQATGEPIDDSLRTGQMYHDLVNQPDRFQQVDDYEDAVRGDIIISPNAHVGIASSEDANTIISNSSGTRTVQEYYNYEEWTSRFGTTYIFHPL